jgi:hypothetical protein
VISLLGQIATEFEPAMPILLHGTTWYRAERILRIGPDPHFVEPGSAGSTGAESFSTCLENGPFPLGRPEEYARNKASIFRDEGGAAIIAIDVPLIILKLAESEYFPLDQGLVQFDLGAGLEELIAAWSHLPKQIQLVDPG